MASGINIGINPISERSRARHHLHRNLSGTCVRSVLQQFPVLFLHIRSACFFLFLPIALDFRLATAVSMRVHLLSCGASHIVIVKQVWSVSDVYW